MNQRRPRVIRGSVREASEPVAGAVVSFVAGPTALPDIATLTDPSGDFSLSAPISGQIPKAIDTEASTSHKPAGHPPSTGAGKLPDWAYPSAAFD